MGVVVSLFLWLASTQDTVDDLIRMLSDDRVEVRIHAIDHLAELYLTDGAGIRKRAERETDPEVKGRVWEAIREGKRRRDRRAILPALSSRVRKIYPDLGADLFSSDPSKQTHALTVLGRSNITTDPKDKVHGTLHVTDSECRKLAPHLAGILRPHPQYESVRLAWIEFVAQRPFLLSNPELLRVTNELFGDPSPKVRTAARHKLYGTIAFVDEAKRLLADISSLSEYDRNLLDQAIITHGIEEGYPYLRTRLRDDSHASRVTSLILQKNAFDLVPEVAKAFAEGARIYKGVFEALPRALREETLLGMLDGPDDGKAKALSLLTEYQMAGHVERVVQQLRSTNFGVRSAAVSYLTRHGSSRLAPEIAQCLKEFWGSPESRPKKYTSYGRACCTILMQWKATKQIEGLVPYIKDRHSFSEAHEMLMKVKPKGTARQVAALVDPNDFGHSSTVLTFLGVLGAKEEFAEHLPLIRRILTCQDERIWRSHAHGLAMHVAKLGFRDFIPLFVEWGTNERRKGTASYALRQLWTADEKIRAFESSDKNLRYLGLWSVWQSDPPRLWERLLRMSSHEDPEVRVAVAFTLGYYNGPDREKRALAFTRDTEPRVAQQGARLYLEHRNPKPRGQFHYSYRRESPHDYTLPLVEGREFLNHPNAYLRLAAARGLTPEAVEQEPSLLLPLLKDPQVAVQEVAWNLYLLTIGPKEPAVMADRLLKYRTDAWALYQGLETLKSRVDSRILAPRVHQFLKDLLSGSKVIKERKFEHMHGATVWGKSSLVSKACEILQTARYQEAEPTLLDGLRSSDTKLRSAILRGFGAIRSEAAVPILIGLLDENNTDWIRRMEANNAAGALGRMGIFPEGFLDPKKPALTLRLQAIRVARHRPALDDVMDLVHAPHWGVSTAAVQALAVLAEPADAERILGLVHTPVARNRAGIIKIFRRFPVPHLAKSISPYLDDRLEVALEAARFMAAHHVPLSQDLLPVNPDKLPVEVLAIILPLLEKRDRQNQLPRLLEAACAPASSKNWQTTYAIAKPLIGHGDPEALQGLLDVIRKYPPHARQNVIPKLAKAYGKATIEFLREELENEESRARFTAARALADLGDHDSRDEIRAVLEKQPLKHERWMDVEALLSLGLRETAERILEDSPNDRMLAVAAKAGFPGARKTLIERLGGEDYAAATLIVTLNSTWNPELWQERLPRISISRIGDEIILSGSKGPRLVVASAVASRHGRRYPRRFWHETIPLGGIAQAATQAIRPYSSFYVTPEGIVRIEKLGTVRRLWVRRLSK